jgi:hypothetical protein
MAPVHIDCVGEAIVEPLENTYNSSPTHDETPFSRASRSIEAEALAARRI